MLLYKHTGHLIEPPYSPHCYASGVSGKFMWCEWPVFWNKMMYFPRGRKSILVGWWPISSLKSTGRFLAQILAFLKRRLHRSKLWKVILHVKDLTWTWSTQAEMSTKFTSLKHIIAACPAWGLLEHLQNSVNKLIVNALVNFLQSSLLKLPISFLSVTDIKQEQCTLLGFMPTERVGNGQLEH